MRFWMKSVGKALIFSVRHWAIEVAHFDEKKLAEYELNKILP